MVAFLHGQPFSIAAVTIRTEKRSNHPVVGELELSYNRIDVAAHPGLMIVTYTAEPGSRSQEALSLLASWAATEETQETVSTDGSAHTETADAQ